MSLTRGKLAIEATAIINFCARLFYAAMLLALCIFNSALYMNNSRKFQTWNHGRVVVSEEAIGELKTAKKEGRFSEALLDRREKLKSDRYCK